MTEVIEKTVEVACLPERAFEIFVHRIASWWPLEAHAVSAASGQAALAVTIEPMVGGAVTETKFDGSTAQWGEVLEFVPGKSFAMSWHPGTDPQKATRVEVEFVDLYQGKTRVVLRHSGWDVWGEENETKRGSYSTGWDFVLERYVQKV